MKNKLIYYIYSIGLCATIYYNGMNTGIAKMVAMCCIGLLCFLAYKRKNRIPAHPVFSSWVKWIIIAFCINIIYSLVGSFTFSQAFPSEQAIPLLVAFSSYYLIDSDDDKLNLYLMPICGFSAFCAIYSVLVGIGGFVVDEYYEAGVAKNQIGAAFSTVAIICAVFSVEKGIKWWLRIPYIFFSILNVYPAIYFSCRAALIGYGVCVIFLLFREYKLKGLLILPFLLIFAIVLGGESLQELLYTTLIGRRDTANMDDITSGRISAVNMSISYFSNHQFFGFYGSGEPYSKMPHNAHNFLILHITKWGVIGVIPYLALYFSIFKIFIRSFKAKHLLVMGTLFLAFLESFAEYAPPFGPGSCFTITYFLVGIFLRKEFYKQ